MSTECGKWAYVVTKSANIIYSWSMENFHQRYASGEPLISSIFYAHSNNGVGFHLTLYPKGVENESDYADIELKFISCVDTEIDVTCETMIRRPLYNDCINKKTLNKKFKNGQVDLLKQFASRNTMIDRYCFTSTGTFTLRCEINIESESIQRFSSEDEETVLDLTAGSLVSALWFLREKSTISDVIINVGNKQLPAHKTILAARSPVFSAMFENKDTFENQNNQIIISDFSVEAIEALLDYIYTDRMMNYEVVQELLVAANKYGMDHLKDQCARVMFAKLSKDKAAEILIFTDLHNVTKLKADTIKYINENLIDIIETAGYLDMEKTHPHLLLEVLRASAKKPRLA